MLQRGTYAQVSMRMVCYLVLSLLVPSLSGARGEVGIVPRAEPAYAGGGAGYQASGSGMTKVSGMKKVSIVVVVAPSVSK